MILKHSAILLASSVLVVVGQYVHDGVCPSDLQVVQNFDLDKYMGKWYEIQRYEVYFERDSECVYGVLTKTDDGSVTVENSGIKKQNPRTFTLGKAILADLTADPQVGKLIVSFNNRPPGTTANYNILDTDYENYSIVFNCQNMANGKRADVAWILSRSTTLNADVEEKVNEMVKKYLQKEQLRYTQQDSETCG